jgi:uncharacterized protein (TIGR02118 family)
LAISPDESRGRGAFVVSWREVAVVWATVHTFVTVFVTVFVTDFGGDESRSSYRRQVSEPMIKISIFYPNIEGAQFDMDYYLTQHMPLSIAKLSASHGYRGVSVDHGVGGGAPGSGPTYIAMCNYLFDSAQDFLAAYNDHADVLQRDMPNYTNLEPIIQFSTVEIS